MTEYQVTFTASARRELRDLPASVVNRPIPKIRELASNPWPSGSRKLHGYRDRWRIRIGDYRVVYTIDEERRVVDIARIAHRGEVYTR